jgi:hypothetical protein
VFKINKNNMKEQIITTKFSDTQIKVTTVIPSVVVPEKIIEVIVSIDELEATLKELEGKLVQANASRAFDAKLYDDAMVSHDAIIADIQKQIDAQIVSIKEANNLGVILKTDIGGLSVGVDVVTG